MLCLTKYTVSGPSSRYRVHQFLPFLQEAGFQVDIQALHTEDYLRLTFTGRRPSSAYLLRRVAGRLAKLATAPKYDVIFIQKEIFPYLPGVVEWLLGVTRAKLVLDIDDAVFLPYETSSRPILSGMLRRKFPGVLRRSRLVLAGNAYLESYARRHTDNVVLFPTVVDADRFRPVQQRKASPELVCGWIGSPHNLVQLESVATTLERASKVERFRLVLIGANGFRMSDVHVEEKPWSQAREVDDLAGIDIGLMPLNASDWSEGKCALKLIQYMSMGMPSISSPRGAAREIIADGVNGFLADTPDEWYEKLIALLQNQELRAKMGRRARRWVEENYNLNKYGPILAEQLMMVAKER